MKELENLSSVRKAEMRHGTPPVERPPTDGPSREEFNSLLHLVEGLVAAAPPREGRLDPRDPPQNNQSPTGIDASSIEKFKRLNPPTFAGGADHSVAESWIDATEKYSRCWE